MPKRKQGPTGVLRLLTYRGYSLAYASGFLSVHPGIARCRISPRGFAAFDKSAPARRGTAIKILLRFWSAASGRSRINLPQAPQGRAGLHFIAGQLAAPGFL